ncbi:MAG TPA: hypothetical protein VF606_07445 [Geminicoccaceae bacterium]|jgi:hypothetical protein
MNIVLRRLPVVAAVAAFAVALTPHVATAATTVPLFPANNVVLGSPGVFGTVSVRLSCGRNDLTIIESPGSSTGVIVDNLLNLSVSRRRGPAGPTQNLCTQGNGAQPANNSGNSCFSSANASAFTPGTPANSAYTGIGTVTVPTVPGVATYTFQLVNAPGGPPNPQANNALRLRTSCRVR